MNPYKFNGVLVNFNESQEILVILKIMIQKIISLNPIESIELKEAHYNFQ